MCGGDVQALPLEVHMEAQRRWKGENAWGRRGVAGYVIEALKKILGSTVVSRRLDLVTLEMTKKAAIYNTAST